jgi:hypothetical protein
VARKATGYCGETKTLLITVNSGLPLLNIQTILEEMTAPARSLRESSWPQPAATALLPAFDRAATDDESANLQSSHQESPDQDSRSCASTGARQSVCYS